MSSQLNLTAARREASSWRSAGPTRRQRRFQRFSARGVVRLWAGDANVTPQLVGDAHLRDISRGGVGVITDRETRRGEFWHLQFLNDRAIIASQPGFSRYCRPIRSGGFLVGIEFGIDACILLAAGVSARHLFEADTADVFEEETER